MGISYSPLHGLSASFRQHVHAYEFAPDAGKEKKHFIDWYWLSQNDYWLFWFQASKCELTFTEPKGDKEEGKSYNRLDLLIFLMGEASLETR